MRMQLGVEFELLLSHQVASLLRVDQMRLFHLQIPSQKSDVHQKDQRHTLAQYLGDSVSLQHDPLYKNDQ